MNEAEQFFYDHAGYSYVNGEAPEVGRQRTARDLAEAEKHAKAEAYTYVWDIDQDANSSDFNDESPPWNLWVCAICDDDDRILEALGGIDLGRDGHPDTDPYARVVQAQLALETREEVDS